MWFCSSREHMKDKSSMIPSRKAEGVMESYGPKRPCNSNKLSRYGHDGRVVSFPLFLGGTDHNRYLVRVEFLRCSRRNFSRRACWSLHTLRRKLALLCPDNRRFHRYSCHYCPGNLSTPVARSAYSSMLQLGRYCIHISRQKYLKTCQRNNGRK